jgi:DNA-binding NarL/FixJ family response regulator
MTKINVMLADDHEMIRQGLKNILQLEDSIAVIGEVNSGEALLLEIEKGMRPDIVLMDIQMRGMSGIEATQKLRQRFPDMLVIGLSAMEEDSMMNEMLRAGASGYLIKSMAASELINAIHRTINTRTPRVAEVQHRSRRAALRALKIQKRYRATLPIAGLTEREQEVVKTLMEGHSNKEIARRLYISERTVQTHLSNIFHKMKVNSRTEAVLVAMRDGWLTV